MSGGVGGKAILTVVCGGLVNAMLPPEERAYLQCGAEQRNEGCAAYISRPSRGRQPETAEAHSNCLQDERKRCNQ
jgi:hypothetical protein